MTTGEWRLLMPHICIQLATLAFSVLYFTLYAIDYFYTELHQQQRKFIAEVAAERLWLCTIFLLVAGFEMYVLVEVCALAQYLSALKNEKRRRYAGLDI
jgi:hypothetical protein